MDFILKKRNICIAVFWMRFQTAVLIEIILTVHRQYKCEVKESGIVNQQKNIQCYSTWFNVFMN